MFTLNNRKKVCIVTAARSEYGMFRWIIDGVTQSDELQLQLVATGAHLSPEHGMTIRFIEEDGYQVDEKVPMSMEGKTASDIAASMGECAQGLSQALNRLNPDILVVLGDRYELLPICSTALVMGIPIAHISGGDVTEGAIDDQVRNAVTMMATLHFPSTEGSAENIRRMRGRGDNIFIAGEPSLDNFMHSQLMPREELADNLKLDIDKNWYLVTLHPETKQGKEYNLAMVDNMVRALKQVPNAQFVVSKSNADLYGYEINEYLQKVNDEDDRFRLFDSLGQTRYMSFMKQVDCVVGNSSSGIVEAPFLGKPVVNIGDRQKGRHQCSNVMQVSSDYNEILTALMNVKGDVNPDFYYGDGHGAAVIVNELKKYLLNR